MQRVEDANPLLGRCHAIVQQMAPSDEQLPAILERGRDVALTAGAGAGKTRALIARYLSLLAEGLPLRSVVAITFTRKAAREMRNRARREIRRYLERPDLPAAERDRWQSLYSELDAARISTIHTLCAEILRSHPAEAGLDPRFSVLDEGPAALLRARAVEEALGWAADDSQAVALFAALPEKQLREILGRLLARRLDAAAAFTAPGNDPLAHWTAALGRELEPGDADLGHLFPALRATFIWTADRYVALKAEEETLDFDDLEAGALDLLRGRRDVRARWQGEVSALLVDEFQDINARQGELVRLLSSCPVTGTGAADGRLFIVGDAKQSIYRFRGADVAVFRCEREAIAARGGACLNMVTSYRAHRELVGALNALLEPVLGDQTDPSRPWVEPFAELKPHREQAGAGFRSPHIDLQLTVGSKTGGALARAAAALAVRMRGMVDSGAYTVFEDGREEPLRYDHIAVLCRASSAFPCYEDAFEAADVPYLTVAGGGFYERPEIRDLLNALRALSDPTDDLALAGLLRSPAFALSDAGLYHLALASSDGTFRSFNVPTPVLYHRDGMSQRSHVPRNASSLHLWDILRTNGPTLPGQDGSRAARAADLIVDLHDQVGRASIGDLLKALLDATDYKAALRRTGGARAARNVAKLLADAQASGLVQVGDFLETVAQLQENGAREGEARATAEGAAQIMSIHAAKGLEFPVVVIGDAFSGRNWSDEMIIHPQLGVLLPPKCSSAQPSAVYAQARTWEQDQEEAESNRLLYVAATRAQERLIFSGCVRLKKDSTPGWLGNSWLGRVAGPDALDFARLRIPHNEAGDQAIRLELKLPGDISVACTVYEPNYRPPSGISPESEPAVPAPLLLPPPLLSPVQPDPVTTDDRTAQQERDPGQRVWRVVPVTAHPHAPGWVVGSIVHDALAVWRLPGDGGEAEFERWASARARGRGLTDLHQVADAVVTSRRLLLRFRDHSLYAELANAEQRMHEVPYSRINETGQVESGVIDALYLQGGAWTIVEFKTDRVADLAALEELLQREDYVPQMFRYQAAVEKLVGQRPRLAFCFLDCGAAVHVRRL